MRSDVMEAWVKAKLNDGTEVRVRQCAAGSDMFVSDTEDYYKVTELEFTAAEESDPMSGLKKALETLSPANQQKALQRERLSFFWAEQRVEVMKIILQRRFLDTPTEALDLTDMIINRLYEQNDKLQDRLRADLR